MMPTPNDQLADLLIEHLVQARKECDEARHVARALWLLFTYREKEERNPGLVAWIKRERPWILEE